MFFRNKQLSVWRPLAAALSIALAIAVGACSSDEENLVGTEFLDDILGSEPGRVVQDTLFVLGTDTVLAFNTLVVFDTTLQVGRRDGYQRAAVVRPDFSDPEFPNATVQSADLRVRLASGDETPVRFYRLREEYDEGDSLATLDTLSAIVDPETGSVERDLNFTSALFPLPTDLVQGWIRGDSANTTIAIVQEGTDNRLATVKAREARADRITVQVTYVGGDQESFAVAEDGTFIRPLTTTDNLIVSDGYVRRVWFRFDTDQLSDSASVNKARIRFNIVPGTVSDDDAVELYIPDSPDFDSPSFLRGQLVTSANLSPDSSSIEFPVTNSVLAILAGELDDNGFAMRFVFENSGLRYVEFYGSDAGALRPSVVLTTSLPATFDEGGGK